MRFRWPYVRRYKLDAALAECRLYLGEVRRLDAVAASLASRVEGLEGERDHLSDKDLEIVSLRRERDGWHGAAEMWHVELCRLEDLTGLHGDTAWADVAPPEATVVITPTEAGVAASAR